MSTVSLQVNYSLDSSQVFSQMNRWRSLIHTPPGLRAGDGPLLHHCLRCLSKYTVVTPLIGSFKILPKIWSKLVFSSIAAASTQNHPLFSLKTLSIYVREQKKITNQGWILSRLVFSELHNFNFFGERKIYNFFFRGTEWHQSDCDSHWQLHNGPWCDNFIQQCDATWHDMTWPILSSP